jgi:hypothetical protein
MRAGGLDNPTHLNWSNVTEPYRWTHLLALSDYQSVPSLRIGDLQVALTSMS